MPAESRLMTQKLPPCGLWMTGSGDAKPICRAVLMEEREGLGSFAVRWPHSVAEIGPPHVNIK